MVKTVKKWWLKTTPSLTIFYGYCEVVSYVLQKPFFVKFLKQ